MICKHQFLDVGMTTRMISEPNALSLSRRFVDGINAVCVHCGEVRAVYGDGVVMITREGGKPLDEDNDNTR